MRDNDKRANRQTDNAFACEGLCIFVCRLANVFLITLHSVCFDSLCHFLTCAFMTAGGDEKVKCQTDILKKSYCIFLYEFSTKFDRIYFSTCVSWKIKER